MQNLNSIKTKPRRNSGTEFSNKARALAAAVCCGLVLLTGFFFAGRQHFSSMDYGIRNSRLRKQLDDLRAEKQRLLYTREVSLSPNEIKKAARKAGMFERHAVPISPGPELASIRRNKDLRPANAAISKPIIIKTGSVAPAAPKMERTLEVVARNEKPEKRTVAR